MRGGLKRITASKGEAAWNLADQHHVTQGVHFSQVRHPIRLSGVIDMKVHILRGRGPLPRVRTTVPGFWIYSHSHKSNRYRNKLQPFLLQVYICGLVRSQWFSAAATRPGSKVYKVLRNDLGRHENFQPMVGSWHTWAHMTRNVHHGPLSWPPNQTH